MVRKHVCVRMPTVCQLLKADRHPSPLPLLVTPPSPPLLSRPPPLSGTWLGVSTLVSPQRSGSTTLIGTEFVHEKVMRVRQTLAATGVYPSSFSSPPPYLDRVRTSSAYVTPPDEEVELTIKV